MTTASANEVEMNQTTMELQGDREMVIASGMERGMREAMDQLDELVKSLS